MLNVDLDYRLVNLMGKKPRRDCPPWPVAPIPVVPSLSKELRLPEVVERLDRWSEVLDDWLHIWRKRNSLFHKRLPEIERQIRLLIERTDELLPQDAHRHTGTTKDQTNAARYDLLARCLSCQLNEEKDEQAVRAFKTAIALAPTILEYWLNYVRHLVGRGLLGTALAEINAIDLRHLESEGEEGAMIVVNWALAYPEIGLGIHPDILKYCVARVSTSKRGALILGSPFPHTGDGKWRHDEIIRILSCGMFGSLSLDELCRREGIKETTYHRWRKRYLCDE